MNSIQNPGGTVRRMLEQKSASCVTVEEYGRAVGPKLSQIIRESGLRVANTAIHCHPSGVQFNIVLESCYSIDYRAKKGSKLSEALCEHGTSGKHKFDSLVKDMFESAANLTGICFSDSLGHTFAVTREHVKFTPPKLSEGLNLRAFDAPLLSN